MRQEQPSQQPSGEDLYNQARQDQRAFFLGGGGAKKTTTAAPPTYAIAADNAGDGRDKMREVVRGFLFAVDNPDPWENYSNAPPPPIAHAVCIDVGVGKTQITIEELAIWLRQKERDRIVYAVPRHRLGEDILRQFTEHGINARIFRGREADDPLRP